MFKRLITCSLLLIAPLSLLAQEDRAEVGIFTGISTYSGDLTESAITYRYSHPSAGIFFRKTIYNNFGLRLGVDYGRLSGSDKHNDTSLMVRNLSFITNLVDAHLLAEYNFFNYDQNGFTPYFFAGVSVFHFNPFVYDGSGGKVFLKPLSTEGEGLKEYPNRKPYSLTQISIPFGLGIKYALTSTINLGFEFRINKTFTDYIDDVSTTYVDPAVLLREKGPLAVKYAYRTNELGNPLFTQEYPFENGVKRGDPKIKDWYYFTGITISYTLGVENQGFWGTRVNPLLSPGQRQ